MSLEALFKISHGMYITGTRDANDKLVGSCIDSAMVVEVDPKQVLISLGKKSYTCESTLKNKKLTLSVLPDDISNETIKLFGMQTSKTVDKWSQVKYHLENNLPVLDEAISTMNLEVISVQETTTHIVFLCNVTSLKSQNEKKPLIYANYQSRMIRETKDNKKWVCKICGYTYDGEIPFEQLPEDWKCPLCGVTKSEFIQQ